MIAAGRAIGSPAAVTLRGWGWRHGGRSRWALRGVDLHIEPGERVLLLGPSGSGKSTLLLAIAGLLDPAGGESEGQITVGGVDPHRARDRTGLVLQDPETQLVMARAGDDVAFGLENLAVPREEIWPRVDAALAAVGFPYGRERLTDQLSGGEQQRLVLAGTFALRPSVLLLDEPTANLDPDGAALVRDVVEGMIRDTGATLVLVEHRVEHVVSLVDRVVVLEAGAGVVADGAPQDVFDHHRATLTDRGVWVPGTAPPPRHASSGVGRTVLTATEVSVTYPGAGRAAAVAVAAVDRASIELHARELVAVVGPNGSGKSTLGLVLSGLLAPDDGGAFLCGRDRRSANATALLRAPLHEWPAARLADCVGTVFQNPEHQFLRATVAEELAFGPRRAGRTPPEVHTQVEALLERLFLAELREANPFTLSGGEKRRLSVATALATGTAAGPNVLVLDEPTFGQDRNTWVELVDLLAELRNAGTALLCLTHDETFVATVADRVVAMRSGSIVPGPDPGSDLGSDLGPPAAVSFEGTG